MNRISTLSTEKQYRAFEKEVRSIARRALFLFKQKSVYVEFFIVSNTTMRHLNRTYRKKDKVTNILSFPNNISFPRPDVSKKLKAIGEIYLAPAYIQDKKDDIKLLVIHGILHCLGYTHTYSRDRIKMESLENAILAKLS